MLGSGAHNISLCGLRLSTPATLDTSFEFLLVPPSFHRLHLYYSKSLGLVTQQFDQFRRKMEGRGGIEKVVPTPVFLRWVCTLGQGHRPCKYPSVHLYQSNWTPGACPESCAALQRLALLPGPLCASSPAQEQWAAGWLLPTNL